MEISVFDQHHGKLCWGAETGEDYDIYISGNLFKDACQDLLGKALKFGVSEILFPFGQDFFNVNNAQNTTAAGTPQTEDTRWQKSFISGKVAAIEAVLMLRKVAPVRIVVVPGNHDPERLFYLGEVLEAFFRSTPNVTVDNSPRLRKYHRHGNSLIGFTHGDKEKKLKLPILMATEVPKLFAATKFREWHVGHLHQKQSTHFQATEEDAGIRIRVIPSLCPADAWHKSMGFIGLRSAEAFLWSDNDGCVANLNYSP